MDESENLQRFKRFGARRSSCWGFWPAANTSGLDNYPTFFFVSFVFSFVQRRLFFRFTDVWAAILSFGQETFFLKQIE